jgi:hypothetical protein
MVGKNYIESLPSCLYQKQGRHGPFGSASPFWERFSKLEGKFDRQFDIAGAASAEERVSDSAVGGDGNRQKTLSDTAASPGIRGRGGATDVA